ncbi:MAG: type II secretion system secretin GspD [Bradymonadales bacterium]|jgi:general secretion pathway protein D
MSVEMRKSSFGLAKRLGQLTGACFLQVLVLLFATWGASSALAQSPDQAELGPDGRESRPGVVKRDAPRDTAPPVQEEPGTTVPSAAAGQGAVESGVIFGEEYQFEPNFNADYAARPTPSNVKVTLDFRDADLSDVVKLMSAQTGRNFIVADTLKSGKKITIISPNPVSAAEAYQAFLSALQMNGLTVVRSGKFYKIVDVNAGIKEPISPTWDGQNIDRNDALVTHIISLEFLEVSQVKPVLDQLKTPNGLIVDYPASNTLIITDTGNSVNRMISFIKRIDNGSSDGERLWVYPVQYAEAAELERLLQSVFQVGGTARQQPQGASAQNTGEDVKISQIVADQRTNKLIIVANERSYEKVKRLLLHLDVEIPDSGRINVVHLQNSEALEISSVLTELLQRMQQGTSQRSGGANQSGGQLLQGDVSVVANASTNDLIVVASPRDFLSVKSVIKELDRPRRQVFVEAVIMEVSLERSRELGVAMHGGNTFATDEGDGYYAGRTELNKLQSLSPAAMFLGAGSTPGFLAALAGPTLDIAGIKIPSMGVVLQALQTNTDTNVLSTPTILTLDNQEAEISVGERIPYITNTGSNYSGLLNSSALAGNPEIAGIGNLLGGMGYGTQIERIDVALTLRIKPQINEGGSVRLDIDEEIEEVKPGGSDLGGPTTRMRNMRTVVVVPDQQTVVLGGLVRDSESQSVSKVPLLGDIPVLGYLFRSTATTIQKQNLLLMLTPYIIESNVDLEKIRIRKQKERDEFLEYFGRRDLNYVRSVNYDKKHGILEEIRQVIDAQENELSAIREAQNVMRITTEDEGIELPAGFSDGYGGSGSSAGRTRQGSTAPARLPNRPARQRDRR